MKSLIRKHHPLRRLRILIHRFNQAEIPTRAAALAYHTLLSIIPVVGLVFWYLQRIGLAERWLLGTRQFVLSQLNVSSSRDFLVRFDELTRNVEGKSWGWVGIALLSYTAWNLIMRFGQSLDTVLLTRSFRAHGRGPHLLLMARRVLVMILLPLALTVVLALTEWLERDSWLRTLFKLHTIGPFFALPLAWGGEILVVFSVYYFIPRVRIPWAEALKAALFVAPANEFIRLVFGLYNHHAVSSYKIYGVLSVIPLFILWVQLSWMLLLGGALLIKQTRIHPQYTG